MDYFLPAIVHELYSSIVFRTLLIILVTWWSSWLWSRRKLYALSSQLPGPLALPLLGNSIELGCFSSHEDIISKILDMKQKYGEYFSVWLGPEFAVVLSEPEDYEAVLLSKSLASKGRKYDILKTVIGAGILTASGSRWKKFRHMINPAFAVSTIRSYQYIYNKHARSLVNKLSEEYCDKGVVDVEAPTQRYAADCLCDSLFDLKLDFKKGDKDDVLMSTTILTKVLYERICKVWLLPETTYRLSSTYKVQSINEKLFQGCYHTALRNQMDVYMKNKQDGIEEDTSEWVENNSTGRKPLSVLATLMDAVIAGEASHEDILVEFDNIFNPGMDTVYTQISALMMLMGMHQNHQSRLWREVKEVCQEDWEADITSEHLARMPFLDMCVKEAMRMFSTATIQMRHVNEDFYLKSRDITIPANTSIVLVPFLLHRHPKYWKNPMAFNPDRFLPEEVEKRPHFAYVPFSAGLRNCIGQTVGVDVVKIAFVHLMKSFHFHSDLKMENLKLKADISVRSVLGYRVSITKRDRNI